MAMTRRLDRSSILLIVALLSGCTALPPSADFPKVASAALVNLETNQLGRQFADTSQSHGANSGFRIIPVGAYGFLIRMQIINAAVRSLDLQYFIFRGDATGRLLTGAVLNAADRGVRVRVLIDDAETVDGDDQIMALEAHPAVEIRIFNPFAYQGHARWIRAIEVMLDNSRLLPNA
jgi:putative cardiolipin synthase